MNTAQQFPRTAQLQRELRGLWTVQDVCERYGVTAMSVHLWRERGLPTLVLEGEKRPAIRFVPTDVREWRKQSGY